MSPEERDELMQFILESQSNAAQRHQEAMKRLEDDEVKLRETAAYIGTVAKLTHELVETARIHSRRLDRLEGLSS